MNETDLRLLVERYHTGDLTPAEEKTLEQALEDPAARRLFVQDMTLLAALRSVLKVEHSNQPNPAADEAQPAAARPSAALRRANSADRRAMRLSADAGRSRWSRIRVYVAAAALLLIVCGLAAAYLSGSREKTNTVVAGEMFVDGRKTVAIADGSLAECGSGAPAKIRLVDGSTLDLEPSSAAVLRNRRIDLRSGKGTFNVTKGDGEFNVQTDVGTLTVLGTAFSVALQPKPVKQAVTVKSGAFFTMTVSVTTGSVGVDCEGARTVLNAGQTQTFGGDPVPPPVLVQVPVPPPVVTPPVVAPPALVLPPELKGFEGMLTGKVVSVSADSIVLEMKTGNKKGDTRNIIKGNLKGQAVLVIIKDVKNPPQFKVDDGAYCTCKEVDGQLVASALVQVKGAGRDVHQDDTF